MKTIRELYRIGRGPSSSHTMGPAYASERILKMFPEAESIDVILYDSLAKTGKGHQTDVAISKSLGEKLGTVTFDKKTTELPHPNTMDFIVKLPGKSKTVRAISIGGGALEFPDYPENGTRDIYPHKNFFEVAEYCKSRNMRLSDYVYMVEGDDIKEYLYEVWNTMKKSVEEGLSARGTLPGGLEVERKAQLIFNQRHIDESSITKENRLVCAYSFAVAEQNADSGIIVTAPTCGSAGVMPGALKYMQERKGFSDEQMVDALAAGGIVGNIIKFNASISGAECGCQAEIGAACSMTAAALAELHEMGIDQIEYAAEVAMEHHLGLTCDPICGLVQIPCIERTAVAAMRAINAMSLANFLAGTNRISFDMVVETMRRTGHDINERYRETSEGGLANIDKLL